MALRNGSSGSIGWTDLMTMAGAIEGVHTCRVEVVFSTLGQGHNGGMHIVATARFDVLPGSDLLETVSVNADWPSGKARSEMGLVYNLLWQLDYAIGKAYEQLTLKSV